MNRNETVELLLSVCRPGGARKKKFPGGFWAIALAGKKPNKQRTIGERTIDARRSFDQSMYFLTGVLTVIPFLKRQKPMLKFDAEKLLVEGHKLSVKPEASAAFIRRLRIHEEKIRRLVERIEKS